MQLVLATSNQGKLREFSQFFGEKLLPYSDIIPSFEIVEDGDSFAANALIKARAIYDRLDKDAVVIADDSGISVPLLSGEPGIYSARYAGINASDKDNLNKLIAFIKAKGMKRMPAYYTAALALVCSEGEFVVHGWMHGDVIDEARGEGGFGYDPMFIPESYERTLGELSGEIKSAFSHRTKALRLMQPILNMIKEKR
ncbi:MAG: non-canonical purine NTP pyrophosphatase [Sulfurovaceae bacterium]|nr:non-canonical purine NTP pyrophosphatase [Sulfurovaceae bacterium]